MEACLEASNVTTCLLEVIADRAAEHNRFDVPTIAVTSTIGILALLFAGLSIVQGILTAAPSHRKCSEKAIGPWSKLTKRSWNWSEFRRESLARTPVLTYNENEWSDPYKLKFTSDDLGHGTANQHFPATWFHLLKVLKLHDQVFADFKNEKYLTSCLVDYLPNDVQAAPAHMDINMIVALAAAAGCNRMDLDKHSGYPNIIGSNCQITFRRDPYFGTVAFFQHFVASGYLSDYIPYVFGNKHFTGEYQPSLTSVYLRKDYQEAFSLKSALQQASGMFKFGKSYDLIDVVHGGDVIQHHDPMQSGTGPPSRYTISGPCIHAEMGPGSCGHVGIKSSLCQSVQTVIYFAAFCNFSWLLWGQPWDICHVFPAASINLTLILEVIAAQGSFWADTHPPHSPLMADWIKTNELDEPAGIKALWKKRHHSPRGEPPDAVELFRLCVAFIAKPADTKRQFYKIPRSRRLILLKALVDEVCRIEDLHQLSHCHKTVLYLKTAAILNIIAKKSEIQEAILEGNKELVAKRMGAFLLDSKDGFYATSRIISILQNLTEQVDNSEDTVRHHSALSTTAFEAIVGVIDPAKIGGVIHHRAESADLITHPLLDALCQPRCSGEYKDEKITDPLAWLSAVGDDYQNLLIYRALLLGMVCFMALDSSAVLEADIGTTIVRFL